MNKNCVVYYTHFMDEHILSSYNKLKDECSSSYDVFFAYDNTKKDFNDNSPLKKEEIYLFSTDNLLHRDVRFLNGQSPQIIPGNSHYIHNDFATTHHGYEYLWRIDYDVFFTGNWADLLNHFDDSKADLLATCLLDYDQIPQWHWWVRLYSPNLRWLQNAVPKYRLESLRLKMLGHIPPALRKMILPAPGCLTRCLLPIYRLSQRSAQLINKCVTHGWRGHEEVLLPTMLRKDGLTLEDIGGSGRYVKRKNLKKYYTINHNDFYIFDGTVRASPAVSTSSIDQPDTIYHPVKKDLGMLLKKWPERKSGTMGFKG